MQIGGSEGPRDKKAEGENEDTSTHQNWKKLADQRNARRTLWDIAVLPSTKEHDP